MICGRGGGVPKWGHVSLLRLRATWGPTESFCEMKDGAAAPKLAKTLKKGEAAKAGEKLTRDLAKDVVANRVRRCRAKRIATVKAAPATAGRFSKSNRG